MLPESVREGIKKAASKIASGKMKPGDTMVMKGKDDEEEDMPMEDGEEEMPESEGEMSQEYHSMAQDMMECFENKDVGGLSMLLEELCNHRSE